MHLQNYRFTPTYLKYNEFKHIGTAFEKPDFHVITSIWTMDKTLIISILELILLRSRDNAKKMKILNEFFIRQWIMYFDL